MLHQQTALLVRRCISFPSADRDDLFGFDGLLLDQDRFRVLVGKGIEVTDDAMSRTQEATEAYGQMLWQRAHEVAATYTKNCMVSEKHTWVCMRWFGHCLTTLCTDGPDAA